MALAFVFPGQGSQSIGMLAALAEKYPQVGQTFEEASEALGFNLWQLCQKGPEEKLNQTANTQPAMLAAGVASWRVWQTEGGAMPVVLAGHSLGEYTALVCSGSLSFKDAIQLVADRGQFMQAAVPEGEGAMAAIIGLEDAAVKTLCEESAGKDVLSPVNYNSPGQVVIAGHRSAIQRAVDNAKGAGAKRALILPVSVPSHCELMQTAAEQMAKRLDETEFDEPQIPVIHNFDVSVHQDAASIRGALVQQIEKPVRWVETVHKMAAEFAVDRLVECGPGKVLVGLNKRIEKSIETWAIYDPDTVATALAALK